MTMASSAEKLPDSKNVNKLGMYILSNDWGRLHEMFEDEDWGVTPTYGY